MSILRITGAALVALSGIFAAYVLNSSAKRTLGQTESFLRSQIECFSRPVPRALERCPEEILRGCGYTLDAPPGTLGELLEVCSDADGAVMREMGRLAADIGKGYREEQLALCDYCLSLLEEQRSRISGQLPLKIKVNSALSVAGAAAVVILLI